MHWKLLPHNTEALQKTVSIICFNGGYAGFELVENEIANLCLVVTKQKFLKVGKRWELLLASVRNEVPSLDTYLTGAIPHWKQPLAVFSIPYGFVYKKRKAEKKGLYRLGDQIAVIPSFSGDGMAIALHTASRAAEAILTDSTTYDQDMRRELLFQVRIASLVSWIIANAWRRKIAFSFCERFPKIILHIVHHTRLAKFKRQITK